MKLKKIISLIMAAAVVFSAFVFGAFAEEDKVKLTTLYRNTIHGAFEFEYLGDGYGSYRGFADVDTSGTIRFDRDENGNLTFIDAEPGEAGKWTGSGEYTPVMDNGKGYLVDKDGNRVSDMLDEVSYVETLDDDLFVFWVGDKQEIVFVSFKTNTSSAPENTPAEGNNDNNNDNDNNNNDAPSDNNENAPADSVSQNSGNSPDAGIVILFVSLGAVVIAGAAVAVVVVKKKKR